MHCRYNRVARSLTVSVTMEYESGPAGASDEQQQQQEEGLLRGSLQRKRVSMSKSCRLRYGASQIFDDAMGTRGLVLRLSFFVFHS